MVLVVNGSADAEEESGSGFEPIWQLLTRKNFSTQIRQHEFALLMVTYPWSGESRALRNDLVQLMKYMHAQFQRLRLMLIYRNVEKMLGDILVGDKAVNLVFYRDAVPFKYTGKLSAQTVLASVWHAMSIPSGDLPFKQLNTLEDLEFFVQSTDNAVLLFDICGWVPNILAADNKNTRFSTTTKTNHTNLNQEEGLERDGSVAKKSTVGSQLEPKSDNNIESVGMNLKRDKNTKTSPKSPLVKTENHGFVSEQEICETSEGSSATLWKDGLHWVSCGNDTIGTETNTTVVTNWQGSDHSSSHALFYGSSCTQEEYNYFKVLYTNLSRIARDNMLPPERQRFGLLSNRTVISALSIDAQQKSLLMLQFPDCPNCSKTFDRGDDLEEFVLTPHPLVTELQGEGYKLVPPLTTETASLILFIDRTSLSERLRQRSKAALQEVRQVAFHYLLSYLSDKRKITGEDKILPKTYSSRKDGKKTHSPLSKHVQMQVQSPELLKWLNSEESKVFQVKTAEGGIQIVHRKIDGSLVSSRDQILDYFLKQDNSGSQLSQDKLGRLAKKAGLQLLSGEFPLDKVQVSHIPETISSLIEKASGQTEGFKESVSKESLETEEQHQKLGDIMDNFYTHSRTSKHITDNGNEKQDSGIVVDDMILDPEDYDVKHEHSTTQECPARPWNEQCKNALSTNECMDNDSNQGCRTERVEDSGDQVKHLKESLSQETVAEDYVSQKLDVYDQKRILPESGNGEQNQDSTIAYAEEMALFEKKGEDFDKLDDQEDQNYGTRISFFYSEGGDQLRTILSSGASVPSVVLVDPVKQSHYLFPKDIPITYSSLLDFINSVLNGTVKAYKLSEAFPPSPREPPRPPFVNRDFHEIDSIPRVTVGTFSRLVIGLEDCNETIETSCASSHHPGAAWGKDALVLFSNGWCGFCKRSELVVREVHRFFERCRNSMYVEGEITPNSSARDMSSLSADTNREQSTADVSKGKVTKGDHLKHEPTNEFPSVFQIDCTLNDCSSLLKSSNQEQKELYPALLLFPGGKKDDPIGYEGDISVNDVIEFLASYGSVSNHLYSLTGALWNKMQQSRGSLNACAPWTLSSIPIQIEAPLHMQRTGPEHLLPISEQYGSNQFQEESNRRFSLQKEIQRPTVGSVLVASKNLHGVYPFENSIIIIVKADFNEGFQGLIVNKPLPWDDLPKIYMLLEPFLRPTPIYLGGPIIFTDKPFLSLTRIADLEGFLEVLPGIYYGDPKVTEKIIMMIRVGKVQAHDFCIFLGFTNWGWQQLFDEVAEQAWHFDTYREDVVRWPSQK